MNFIVIVAVILPLALAAPINANLRRDKEADCGTGANAACVLLYDSDSIDEKR
ncbi:hypothetical protein BDV96DRAFT_650299 [Lophiotrema nucula]|uniref:Uncharacterized protein n=1 Tax=Lophiotrema nucula TaxID=690887 RepID=A0A6A5YWF2_9PLEO|nr:hypothetical protein BDV96DRAFT_650299 [Lophiotrema nucula]